MTILMRALNLSSSFITWKSNTPDYEGTYAPESIQSGSTIVVADTGGTAVTKRLPLDTDHALVAFCDEATAPWADSGAMSSGNFTVANGTPDANQPGIIKTSIEFKRNDGNADEAVVGPNNPTLASGVTAITLMAWIYTTGAPTTLGIVLMKQRDTLYSGGSGVTIGIGLRSDRTPTAFGYNLTQTTSAGVVSMDTWHHFAATYDGATLTCWVDGSVSGSAADASGLDWGGALGATLPWIIGNNQEPTNTNRRGFVGRIEDARVITRVLSQSELQDVVARGFLASAVPP